MGKTAVMFLWHNHQPFYKDEKAGIYSLPWVRLHAVKDYYDTLLLLEKHKNIKMNFNLVPSLIYQINDYVLNGSRDIFFIISKKPVSTLTNKDKYFLLKNFFMCNFSTMIDIYPRYKELLDIRSRNLNLNEFSLEKFLSDDKLKNLDENYYRDLITWYNLTWIDQSFRKLEEFKFLNELIIKGKNFTEEEKNLVLDSHIEIMKKILPMYKKLLDLGQIEISTTPFFHPILPLLVDSSVSQVSEPNRPKPENTFRFYEDAKEQIKKGISYYEEVFKVRPNGMWPSEGSVSNDVLDLILKNGIKWVATDEEVLFHSINNFDKNNLYYEYTYKDLSLFFRDKKLSDLIGFSYSKMSALDAVNNFFSNLYEIRNRFQNKDDIIIPIILDGENCWEYFPNDGNDFLEELYTRFENSEDFETVKVSDFMLRKKEKKIINSIYPASWINHNFDIWIGNEEDNKAWDLLYKTRNFIKEKKEKLILEKKYDTLSYSKLVFDAMHEIYVAEGSDWFWWYGDDHNSDNDKDFDELFRGHLINVYKIFGEYAPSEFYEPISKTSKETLSQEFLPIVGNINPTIDGKETNFFEWYNAGRLITNKFGNAMHQANRIIEKFYFGYGDDDFYFRLDINKNENNFFIDFDIFPIFKIMLIVRNKEIVSYIVNENDTLNIEAIGGIIKFSDIIECKIPLDITKKFYHKPIDFTTIDLKIKVKLDIKGVILEEYPFGINRLKINNKFY